jgi:hypothetical protein
MKQTDNGTPITFGMGVFGLAFAAGVSSFLYDIYDSGYS